MSHSSDPVAILNRLRYEADWHSKWGHSRCDPDRMAEFLREAADLVSSLQSALVEQARALAEAQADAQDWLLCMDGIKHDPRCSNHFAGDPRNGPCLRCQADNARELLSTLAAVRALPEQWRDHAEDAALTERGNGLSDAYNVCATALDTLLPPEAPAVGKAPPPQRWRMDVGPDSESFGAAVVASVSATGEWVRYADIAGAESGGAGATGNSLPAPNVQTWGCHQCGKSFHHKPEVASDLASLTGRSIPFRQYFFCSMNCMTRWYQGDSGGNALPPAPASPGRREE